jgi:hypothetical protein
LDIQQEVDREKPIVWMNNEQLKFEDISDDLVEKIVYAHSRNLTTTYLLICRSSKSSTMSSTE